MSNRLVRVTAMFAVLALLGAALAVGSAAADSLDDVHVDPGIEDQENDFVFEYDMSGAGQTDEIQEIYIDFDGAVDAGEIGDIVEDDVTVVGDDVGNLAVDDTQEDAGELLIALDDFFQPDQETGTMNVSVDDVFVQDADTFTAEIEFHDDGTTGVIVSDTQTYTIASSISVDDFESPTVSFYGQSIEVSATITNDGDSARDLDVGLEDLDDATIVDDQEVTVDANSEQEVTFTVSTDQYPSASSGAIDEFQHGIIAYDDGDLGGTVIDGVQAQLTVGLNEEGTITANIQDGGGETLDNATVRLYLADDWDGSVAGSGAPIRQVELGEGESTYTFEELAVGDSGTSEVDYVLHAEREEFNSDSTQESLHYPDNAGPTRTLTLLSALEPNVFGVGAFDADSERVTGDTSAVFANGDFDSQGTFAVFAQTQGETDATLTAGDEVTVDLLVANRTDGTPLEFVTDQEDENTSQYVSVTIDDNSPVANVDGNETTGEFNYEIVHVTAENATEENVDPLRTEDMFAWTTDIDDEPVTMATELTLPFVGFNEDHDVGAGDHLPPEAQVSDTPLTGPDSPLLDNYGSNETDDIGGTDANTFRTNENVDALLNDVFFFVEGDRATQHEVVDVTNTQMHEDATVWAAYDGGPQDFDTIESFQNEADESFLVADEVEGQEGKYVIPGIVEEAPFNVYVDATGYNIYNSTEVVVDSTTGDTLSQETGLPQDTLLADYTLNETIELDDGSGDRYDLTHHLRETVLDFTLNVTTENVEGEFEKHAEVPSPNEKQARIEVEAAEEGASEEDFEPIANQEIHVELVDPSPSAQYPDPGTYGTIENTVTTNEDGVAYANWSVESGIDGQVNVTAWTFNADNDLYQTDDVEGQNLNDDGNQATWDIFTTGILTGDVLDDEEVPIISDGEEPMVEISQWNATASEFQSMDFPDRENPRAVSEGQSQYAFLQLPTGEDYRVDAWVTDPETGETHEGFAIQDDLNAGTNTRDVVIEEFIVDDDDDDDETEPGTVSDDNPFGDADNEPVSELDAIGILDEWRDTGEVDGTPISELEMIGYLDEWRSAQ